jgi:hypothetical protein
VLKNSNRNWTSEKWVIATVFQNQMIHAWYHLVIGHVYILKISDVCSWSNVRFCVSNRKSVLDIRQLPVHHVQRLNPLAYKTGRGCSRKFCGRHTPGSSRAHH